MSTTPDHPPYRSGVVEGFFGKAWSWQDRHDYAAFLEQHHFNAYLYAPKSDRSLRQEWALPFEPEHFQNLQKLAQHYRHVGVDFGIGLSPYELYLNFGEKQKQALKTKLEAINEINPDTLCILFDDMIGSVEKLALSQVEIMDFIIEHSVARHFQFCPTYYSFDPILVRHFGSSPDNYLESLGQLLDSSIDIYWTGPKVFSEDYSEEHLIHIHEILQRPVTIWDNYPVNDSQRLTDFLHLAPILRNTDILQSHCRGLMANPMNQAWLSRIPLIALSRQYQSAHSQNKQHCESLETLLLNSCIEAAGDDLGKLFTEDQQLFQTTGLAQLSMEQKELIKQKYLPYKASPLVQELSDWLDGSYTFDPACLT